MQFFLQHMGIAYTNGKKTNFAPAFWFYWFTTMECHRFIGGKLKIIIIIELKEQTNQHPEI